MKLYRVPVALLALGLVVAPPARAYDTSLSSHAVREAYSLGLRNDERTAEFLLKYITHLPAPKAGPHVFEIELYTPYSQIVDHFRYPAPGVSAQQAERDYRAQSDTLRVRVLILFPFPPTDSSQSAPAPSQKAAEKTGIEWRSVYSWKDFTIHLRQQRDGQEKTIEPIEVRGERYSVGVGKSFVRFGVQILLLFSVADVASAPGRIEVQTPDGQRVTAEFDLGKLR